ncbi:MAG: S9 family peptidase [Pseudomonadales bacterium]|nr:S9 family peptidase [Pseudomonadales bacterium]
MRSLLCAAFLALGTATAATTAAAELRPFSADDVFELEWARAPEIAPDRSQVLWIRTGYDRRSDRPRGALWITDVATGASEPLVTGPGSYHSPRFSPDGTRLAYIASESGKTHLRMRWLASGRETIVADLDSAPRQVAWSPDSTTLAFTLFTPGEGLTLGKAKPHKPDDARWADPMRVIDDLVFRFDGRGYLKEGADQVYVVPAHGGTPRAVTEGGDGFSSPAWSADGKTLYVVGNDGPDPELDPIESEIYAVDVATGARRALTDRDGPDRSPTPSPDGTTLAWLGYDDERRAYQQTELYVQGPDDNAPRWLTADFDHGLSSLSWRDDGQALLAQATVRGQLHLVEIDLEGNVTTLLRDMGGTSLGRPYGSGDHAVRGTGAERVMAWTVADPLRPAELAIQVGTGPARIVTDLNSDLLGEIALPRMEELTVPSRLDGLPIQAWMAIPAGVSADGTAPLLLEIHGGPFAMYTPAFAAEIQRYAAEGYVTVWANPRGSTGYGEAFAQEIDEAYPGPDHEDLMSVVDAVLAQGWVDEKRLFITGGSGGGVLSAYATGMTDRFAAAAVIKPVINWFTMALAGDIGVVVSRHWIRGNPWENPQKYFDRSPIRVVGNVTTPTLVMVGEEDWRTPAWEAEQWYTALKMQGVPSAYVRVPGASHTIAARPSNLVAKVDTIMAWFEKYDPAKVSNKGEAEE